MPGTIISTSTSTGITLTSGDNPVSVTGTIAVSVADALYGPAGTSWTISNSGTISAPSYAVALGSSAGGSVVTNQSGGTIIGGGGTSAGGVSLNGTLTNSGGISGGAGTVGGVGVNLTAGALTNTATGTITGGGPGPNYSADPGGAGVILHGSLNNSGTIAGGAGSSGGSNGGGAGDGIDLTTGSVTNAASGMIVGGLGGAGGYHDEGGGGGIGANLVQSGTLTNNATIVGGQGGQSGYQGDGGNGGGGVNLAQGGTLVNSAVITGGEGGTPVGNGSNRGTGGFGVYLGSGATLANSGTITGGFAYTGGYGVELSAGGSLTNTGTITGGYGVNAGAGVALTGTAGLTNTGATIVGGNGANDGGAGVVLTGTGGLTITGTIDGGNGTGIVGGGGDGISMAGTGSLDNSAGAIVTGGNGHGYGGGGAGIYRAATGTLTNEGTIAGGTGDGALAGVDLKLGGVVSNTGSISGLRGVYAGGGGSVTNQTGGVITASGTAIVITGGGSVSNSGDIAGQQGIDIETGGSVTNQGSGVITASGYAGIYITGGSGGVINSGTVESAVIGVAEKAGGSVTNNASAGITSDLAVYIAGSVGNVVNLGTLLGGRSGVDEEAGGSLTNATAAIITASTGGGVYIGGAPGTVVNAGAILGTSNGVEDHAGGYITNAQGATIAATSGPAIYTHGAATIVNDGTLSTGNTIAIYEYGGGSIANLQGGAIVGEVKFGGEQAGYLTNAAGGTITSTSRLGVIADDVQSTVINSGVILAGDQGVYAQGAAGYVTNNAGAAITGDVGVALYSGTVVNAGTIITTVSNAVAFYDGSSTTNRLVVVPGAVFVGNVYTSVGGVVELASAASAGTLSGFGTTITNFTSLVFDKRAQWTIAGNDSAAGLGTLGISGFVSGDTIDLTGFAADTLSFANNELTLTNTSSGTATLNIIGNFVTGDFVYSSDGTGGTNIYFGPSRDFTWTGTGTNDWNTGNAWNLGEVPSPIDNALIGNAGSNLVTITGTESVGVNSLTLEGSNTLLVAGTLSANTIVDNAVLAFAGSQTLDDTPLSLDGTIAEQGTNTLILGAGEAIVQSGTSAAISGSAGGIIVNDGAIDAAVSGGSLAIGPGETFVNNGAILVHNGDTLNVDSIISGGTGAIDIGSGGVADFASPVASSQTVALTTPTGELVLQQPSSFAASILGFAPGNTIDLAGITATTANWSDGTLVISDGGATIAALALTGDYSADAFTVGSDSAGGSVLTVSATCYASGTRIKTPCGEVAVERLREGDMVLTVSGRAQPVIWIGHRRVDLRRHPNRQRVLPIRVATHAFGEGRPKRDLLLSPDHAVFVDDVLIPVRHLVNGRTIVQVERSAITYWHIELPRHDVLLAEDLPAESYLEAGARNAFANYDGPVQLHPDFTSPREDWALLWESQGYAPMVVAGETLERVRRELARQADLLVPGETRPMKAYSA